MKIVEGYLRRPVRQGSERIFGLRSKKSGFSFMEVMIVVAIVSTMTAIGLASLSGGRNRKNLEIEARKVAASIRQAQLFALTGKTGASGDAPCRFEWKNFVGDIANPNSSDYRIKSWKKDAAGACAAGAVATDDDTKYILQNGVTFRGSLPADAESLEFHVPFATFVDGSPVNDQKVTVQKGTDCIDISVSITGKVVEGEMYNCT